MEFRAHRTHVLAARALLTSLCVVTLSASGSARRLGTLVSAAVFFAISLLSATIANAQTHVACVGDSITAGDGASSPAKAYPSVLQNLLGGAFAVSNAGHSGATMMVSGDLPYSSTAEYASSTSWVTSGGDVVIQLGTNDSKPANWSNKASFLADCKSLVGHYLALPGGPRVWLNLIPPATVGACCKINETVIRNEIIPLLKTCAGETSIPSINVFDALDGHPEYFVDGVHPNDQGAAIIAQTVHASVAKLPTISLSTSSSSASEPASIQLTAAPTAAYGKVEKVVFFEGNEARGEATSTPWVLDLNGVGQGSHVYRAEVVETAGRKAASDAVTIIVSPSPASTPPPVCLGDQDSGAADVGASNPSTGDSSDTRTRCNRTSVGGPTRNESDSGASDNAGGANDESPLDGKVGCSLGMTRDDRASTFDVGLIGVLLLVSRRKQRPQAGD